jgi:hypothetical protein
VDGMSTSYKTVIEEICGFDWAALDQTQLSAVAWAYYYFSVQFRENLQVAVSLYPDPQLQRLAAEECATDNLSPWTGVAGPGEKLDHDEFMRRVLRLSPFDRRLQAVIDAAGQHYLSKARQVDDQTRAMSIASYESGGLESVFRSILQAEQWGTPLLQGFQHFLVKHVGFDSDPDEGHGSLIRHLNPDDRIRCLWLYFRDLLVTSVPRLAI